MSFTTDTLFPLSKLSTSSSIIVFIVCAFNFFCFIKSKTLPEVPITIWGFIAFIFFICFWIFTSPIKENAVISNLELDDKSFACSVICITNSWVGASIKTWVSLFVESIFSNIGSKYDRVLPLPVCAFTIKSLLSSILFIVRLWTLVGSVIFCFFKPAIKLLFKFNSLNVVIYFSLIIYIYLIIHILHQKLH